MAISSTTNPPSSKRTDGGDGGGGGWDKRGEEGKVDLGREMESKRI